MGKMLKKLDINLLSQYCRTKHDSIRKQWLKAGLIWFFSLCFILLSVYWWYLKPQQSQLQLAHRETEILQKKIAELNNTSPKQIITAETPTQSISIQQQNADIRDILQQIAIHGDISLILSERIQGNITVFIQSLSWKDALEVVLELGDLIAEEREKVIIIRTKEEIVESIVKYNLQ